MTSEPAALMDHLAEIVTCSICDHVLTNPRMLPCMHSFCFKCIHGYSQDKSTVDQMPCPRCGKQFTVPIGGIIELPKNYFIEKLLLARNKNRDHGYLASYALCESCESADDEGGNQPTNSVASTYCIECQEKMCDGCAAYHRKSRLTRAHQLTSLDELRGSRGADGEPDDKTPCSVPTFCSKHVGKSIELFCRDCQEALCLICFVSAHKKHDCAEAVQIAPELRRRIRDDIEHLANGAFDLKAMLKSLQKRKQDFIDRVENVEKDMEERVDDMLQMIEKQKNSIFCKINEKKESIIEKMEQLETRMADQALFLANVENYSQELDKSGSVEDIMRDSVAIHTRTNELLQFDSIKEALDNLYYVKVVFDATKIATDVISSMIGDVTVTVHPKSPDGSENVLVDKRPVKCKPKLTQIICEHGLIGGVSSMAAELFIVRCDGLQRVEEYNRISLAFQRFIEVPELGREVYGVASCPLNSCLYIADYQNNHIFRVQLSPWNVISRSDKVTKWPVGSNPTGLSVNKSGHLLVSISGSKTLEERTTEGQLLREIALPQQVSLCPWHAIELTDDSFVVSDQTVYIVDSSGNLLQKYDSEQGSSTVGPLFFPAGLLTATNGCVLVADRCNNRLVVLNALLTYSYELPLPDIGKVDNPWTICYDQLEGRLYVGEYDSGRLLVFDDIYGLDELLPV